MSDSITSETAAVVPEMSSGGTSTPESAVSSSADLSHSMLEPDGTAAGHSLDDPDLESDIRLLDSLLDSTILTLEGEESLKLVEEIRAAAQALRLDPSVEVARRLRDRLSTLDIGKLRTLTRAFSLYFDLINLAEQRARVRRAQTAGRRLVGEAAFRHAGNRSGAPQGARRHCRTTGGPSCRVHWSFPSSLHIPAKPAAGPCSKSSKRSRCRFDEMEYKRLIPSERAAALDAIAAEVETFWLTDIIRDHRPTVLDEIRQGLGMVCGTLFEIVPKVYRDLESALARTYPEYAAARSTAAPFRLVDWRRPRRQSQRHARGDARRRAAASGDHSALLPRAGGRIGPPAELLATLSEAWR